MSACPGGLPRSVACYLWHVISTAAVQLTVHEHVDADHTRADWAIGCRATLLLLLLEAGLPWRSARHWPMAAMAKYTRCQKALLLHTNLERSLSTLML